jgi:hypothetical protein
MTTRMKKILSQLGGGDWRSVGQADRIATLAAEDFAVFQELMQALAHRDPLVRMRAADAAEKASVKRPELLQPFKVRLMRLLDESTQQELRWHLAQMIPRLRLTHRQRVRVAASLRKYLQDPSSIVKTFAMQALTELALLDAKLRAEILELIRVCAKEGTPAMRARGRKLLAVLEARRETRISIPSTGGIRSH